MTIPNSVTNVGIQAFAFCTGLKCVTIPDRVAVIRQLAFHGCTGLTSVFIASRLTSIGFSAFTGCPNLTGLYFEGNAPQAGDGVFDGSEFVTVFYRAGSTGWNSSFSGRPTAVWEPRPAFADWAATTGLAAQFPSTAGEGDDPDGDGFTNGAEWFAGTDPTERASHLQFELTPRIADLSTSDQTPIPANYHALYFRSIPGRYYGVQSAPMLIGPWTLQATAVARTAQKRFQVPCPVGQAFYRVVVLP